ncbi:MAG: hypothetical protein R3360_07795, partial [Alphaproteobacteria bacterium]|nr:hypothetical protein [Alphaproteobacteria bacterium]
TGDPAKAIEMVRALAAAGAVERLQGWLMQINAAGQSLGNPASSVRDQLLPYRLLLSGANSGIETSELQAWWNSWGGEPALRARRADMAFAILEAVGYTLPQSAWHQLLADSRRSETSMPTLAVWRGMIDAGANNQMGLGVASVLVALGPDAPAKSHPALVSNAILALRSLGMEREARLLGLEALAASD